MHTGRSLKVALAQRDQTIGWMADQMGVSRQRISKIANSDTATPRTIRRMSEIFNLKCSEFIALGEVEGQNKG